MTNETQEQRQEELIEFEMKEVAYRNPATNIDYRNPTYSFRYSPVITDIRGNYYVSRKYVPEGFRMSTAAEELAIQLSLERAGQDPRKAVAFKDLFTRGDVDSRLLRRGKDFICLPNNEDFVWPWTETGLRVPKGWENGKYQTDAKGNIQYPRIVLIGDQEVGEALVPRGFYERVVVEWNEIFGIPSLTVDKNDATGLENPTYFNFEANPGVDERTGRQDVAVGRTGNFPGDGREYGLHVSASCARGAALLHGGFRQVRGSLPAIKTHDAVGSCLKSFYRGESK